MRFIDKIKKMSDLEEKCSFARCRDFIKEEIEKVAKAGGKMYYQSHYNDTGASPAKLIIQRMMSNEIWERLINSFENDGFKVSVSRDLRNNIYSFTISWE